MRAETRHQLKQDRFSKVTFEAAGNAAHWSVEHQSKLIAAVIAVIVIGAIAFGGWYYVNSQDEKASAELSTAVRTWETPVRPAGVPPQPGDGQFRVGAGACHGGAQAVPGHRRQVSAHPHGRHGALFCGLGLGTTWRQRGRRAQSAGGGPLFERRPGGLGQVRAGFRLSRGE